MLSHYGFDWHFLLTVIQHLPFSVWPISLSITLSVFVHVVVYIRTKNISFYGCIISHCAYNMLLCSYEHSYMFIWVLVFASLEYMPRSGITWTWDWSKLKYATEFTVLWISLKYSLGYCKSDLLYFWEKKCLFWWFLSILFWSSRIWGFLLCHFRWCQWSISCKNFHFVC